MAPNPDELAGAVDGFGGLTRAELLAALADLAARAGDDTDPEALETAVEAALASYHLVELDPEVALANPADDGPEAPLLLAGPAALPQVPDGGEDLPHLVDVEPRRVDRDAVARAVESRLRADAAAAVNAGDPEQAERLLDACYEVEAWGPVDLGDAKAGLAGLLD